MPASSIVTSKPLARRARADESPAGPDPTKYSIRMFYSFPESDSLG